MNYQLSHPVFDLESEIVKAGNCPSPVDLAPWQQRLDDIAGKTVEGRSRLRIVWGQDENLASMICCGRRVHKYPFWYREDLSTIGKPRFFVEELHNLSELNHGGAWERARYKRTAAGIVEEDVLGPIPEEGFYTSVFLIAHHDELCCAASGMVNGEICMGAYRPPADTDLQRIRRMKTNRDQASNDERKPSDARLAKRIEAATEARNEKWRAATREVIDDFMKNHAWRFTEDDPTALGWGRFHFTAGHSKSGLTKENESNVSSDSGRSA